MKPIDMEAEASGGRPAGRSLSSCCAVIVMGIPGSGKTSLARHLSAMLGWPVVSRDAIRAAMFPNCTYSMEEKAAAFRAVVEAARANAALGRSQIVEGMPFSRTGEAEAIEQVVADAGGASALVYCSCPIDVAIARAKADSGSRDSRDRCCTTVTEVAGRFRDVPDRAFVIDTVELIEVAAERVLTHLRDAGLTS